MIWPEAELSKYYFQHVVEHNSGVTVDNVEKRRETFYDTIHSNPPAIPIGVSSIDAPKDLPFEEFLKKCQGWEDPVSYVTSSRDAHGFKRAIVLDRADKTSKINEFGTNFFTADGHKCTVRGASEVCRKKLK